MRRRQFGATLASTALALTGISAGAPLAAAQDTDPIRIQDVSTSLGGVDLSVGEVTMSHEDGVLVLVGTDWSMAAESRSASADLAGVAVDDVSEEAFVTLRNQFAEAYTGQSPAPLVAALAEADISPDAAVEMRAEAIAVDDTTVADTVTGTGTVGGVVPDGASALAEGGSVTELGPMELSTVTAVRGDSEATAEDIVVQREGRTVAVSAAAGEATTPSRTMAFEEMAMTVDPTASLTSAQADALAALASQADDGSLTFSAIRETLADSGVSAAEWAQTARDADVEMTFGSVSQGGQTVSEDLTLTGTVEEFGQMLLSRL